VTLSDEISGSKVTIPNGNAIPLVEGMASCNVIYDGSDAIHGPGVHRITAVYNPRIPNVSNFLTSTSPEVRVIVTAGVVVVPVPPVVVAPDTPVFLGAVDLLRSSEVERLQRDQATQKSDQDALGRAIAPPTPVPLLEIDTQYTITVNHQRNGVAQTAYTKSFRTDKEPPKRLDPWILATSPFADQHFFFRDEPVQFWFNHAWVVDLFAKYKRELTYVLWEANRGELPRPAVKIRPADLKDSANPPVLNPYEQKVREGLAGFPCVPRPPVLPNPNKVLVILDPKDPRPLLPSSTYTLEVFAAPAAPDVAPVFQLSFTTSRYLSIAGMAQTVAQATLSHCILKAALTPPAGASPTPIADIEFQTMLLASGVPFNNPAEQPRTTMLWAAVGAGWRPAALLIETPEPLWRFRPVPTLQTINGPDGSFQQYGNAPVLTLGIEAPGNNSPADRFVYAFGGTRTLVLLKPLTADTQMTLNLIRTQPALLKTWQTDPPAPLWSGTLSNLPPWSQDEE